MTAEAPPVPVTVVIPVGPEERHGQYLVEALQSVHDQTLRPRVLIVDDMHNLSEATEREAQHDPEMWPGWPFRWPVTFPGMPAGLVADLHPILYRPPWRLGIVGGFNHGVAVAFKHGARLAVMLGADDTLERRAIEALVETYRGNGEEPGYYWFGQRVGYEIVDLPCNCAAVTPEVWRATGGLPIEASAGGMDEALIGILHQHHPEWLVQVKGDDARFVYRQHDAQETRTAGLYVERDDIRKVLVDYTVETWREPEWGRY